MAASTQTNDSVEAAPQSLTDSEAAASNGQPLADIDIDIEPRPLDDSGKPTDFREHLDFGRQSDDAIARDIGTALLDRVLSAPKTGEAFVWDRVRWGPDEVAAYKANIRHQCAYVAEILIGQCDAAAEETDRVKSQRRFASSLLSRAKQEAIGSMVKEDPRLTHSVDEFDRAKRVLAASNGYVDLETGELSDADPALLITQAANVAYDPEAKAPRFCRFIDEIADGDPDLARYLQKLAGYAATGSIDEQALFIFHGEGSNGKDAYIETLDRVLGDYVGHAPENMLIERRYDKHLSELYALRGKRLVVASESDRGKRLAMGRVKALTGTPTVTANAMRQDPVTFENTWTLVFTTNYLPVIQGADYGTLRRLVVVPFPVKYYRPDEDRPEGAPVREEGLAERMASEEAEGILAWVVEGAVAYHAEGLEKPAVVRDVTEAYHRQVEDPHGVWAWVQERCLDDDRNAVTAFSELSASYAAWASGHPEVHPVRTDTALGRALGELGFAGGRPTIDGAQVSARYGLRLRVFSTATIDELMAMKVSR